MYDQDYDQILTIEEAVKRRNVKHTALGRTAYTPEEYRSEIIPKLKALGFIEMQSQDTSKLTAKGKEHCKELEKRGID